MAMEFFKCECVCVYQIKQGVEEVQAEVLKKDPRLSSALIPVGTLHITLFVTNLATQEQIDTYVRLIHTRRHLHVYKRKNTCPICFKLHIYKNKTINRTILNVFQYLYLFILILLIFIFIKSKLCICVIASHEAT